MQKNNIVLRIIKSFFGISVILLLVLIFVQPWPAKSQSKLPITNVKVSPEANYAKLKGSKSPQKLIDGKLSTGKIMWLDPNTLGWQNHGRITIDLELKDVASISSISLKTAKNEAAGVLFPLNVNLFTSIDGENYTYIADMSDHHIRRDQLYHTIELKQENINSNAKFIKLEVIPQGNMFFTDEIVVAGSEKSFKLFEPRTLSETEIENIIAKNKQSEINRTLLISQLEEAGDNSSVENLKNKILKTKELADNNVYQQYIESIARLSLSKDKQKGLTINILSSPWGRGKSIGNRTSIVNVVNTTHYVAIEVVNNQPSPYSGSLLIMKPSTIQTILYETKGVKTRNSKIVNDALIPVSPEKIIQFSPGEKKVFILAINAIESQKATIQINFTDMAAEAVVLRYNAADIGINRDFRRQLKFNVNVWPYFNYDFFKGRESQIRKDLVEHYVNVFVIPPTILEPNNLATDHSALKKYLSNYHTGDKVLLFVNHRGYISNPGNFLQPSWKEKFLSWYDRVLKILEDQEVALDNIYLYPFDEIREKEISYYVKFSTWIKSARPQAKIFTTVFNDNVLSEVKSQADIFQLLVKNEINQVKPTKRNGYWIYDIMDGSKQVDPYLRYRLMAWKAFQANAKGIGFWTYADQFGKSVWDDFDGQRADYNVVYDGNNNSIIPSKRWEAFKQGIEDYFILYKYADKFGQDAANKIVSKVIKFSTTPIEGEKARTEMINKLIAK